MAVFVGLLFLALSHRLSKKHRWGYIIQMNVPQCSLCNESRFMIKRYGCMAGFKDCPWKRRTAESIALLLQDAVQCDGGYHKQWYLERIAALLDVPLNADHNPGSPP